MQIASLVLLALFVIALALGALAKVRLKQMDRQSKLYDRFFKNAASVIDAESTPEIVVSFLGILGREMRSSIALPMLLLAMAFATISPRSRRQKDKSPIRQAVDQMRPEKREAVHRAVESFCHAVSYNGIVLGWVLRTVGAKMSRRRNNHPDAESVVEDYYSHKIDLCAA